VLLARYGSGFSDRLNTLFASEGLPFKREQEKVPNSRRALMLGELARDRGLHRELHPRLFDAYWVRGADLGDAEVLLEEGRAVGLEEDEIGAAITDPGYLERVQRGTDAATQVGAGGVPAWLVDQRVMVPGAQPRELFDQVMGRLGYEPTEAESPSG
jgi:predicted DsbA family dithiol-disulfide isomerase